MMGGYFAALAAQALAETEARLQRQEAERRAAAQVEQFDNLARRVRQGDVIDVEAREVPDVLPLPAPATAMCRVSKEAFARFVAAYPRALDRDIARMCEPPVVSFNDFTRGKWPASVVASHTFEAPDSMVPTGWKIRQSATE